MSNNINIKYTILEIILAVSHDNNIQLLVEIIFCIERYIFL